MKKIKIILPIVAALLAIAYFVCSLVIPSETNWFMGQVGVVLNHPITIAGVSMTIGGVIAWILVNFILKNTKFGRKELDGIKKDNASTSGKVEEFQNNVTNQIEEMKKQWEEFKKEEIDRSSLTLNSAGNAERMMIDALKTIPNKKVQTIVKRYEDEKTVNIETEEE